MNDEFTYYFNDRYMPASEAVSLIIKEAEKMDPVSKKAFLEFHQQIFKYKIISNLNHQRTSKVIVPTIGLLGLVGLLFLVFFTPYPSKFQSGVIWIALAIVAAFCAAAIPGYFQIKYKGLIRAGGAFAVFALVFLKKPVVMSDDFSPKIYTLNLYVAKSDTNNITSINVRYQPNDISTINDYAMKTLGDYYGENSPDTFTCYRKSNGQILKSERCTELGDDHDLILLSNQVQRFFKNKREAYDHYNKVILGKQ